MTAAEETITDPLELLQRKAEGGHPGAALELGHRLCVLPPAVTMSRPDETPEAERWLRRALTLDPHYHVAATLLAGLLVRQCEALAAHTPWLWDESAADDEVWYAAMAERLDEAEQWYRHVLAIDPEHGTAASGLALLLAGRSADAIPGGDYEEYMEGEEDEDDSSDERRQERAEEAEYWAQRALSVNPGNPVASGVLGGVLDLRGEPRDAARGWRRVVEINPQDYWSAAKLAMTADKTLDLGEAVLGCRELAEAGDPEAVYSLALLLDAAGQEAEAEAWLEGPTTRPVPYELEPRDGWGPGYVPFPALNRARHFRGRSEARRWATRAVRYADDEMLSHVDDLYAELLEGPDDGADIRAYLERRVEEGHAEAAFALMTIHRAQGREEEAEQWRQRGADLKSGGKGG